MDGAGAGRGYHSRMKSDASLPLDGQRILELAARSMFDLFANASEGMLLVDRNARVVWINDQYRRFLPALGFEREEDFVGHPVSQVVQNTQMHRVLETGKPILIDLLSNKAGTFGVSRIPLRDEQGNVIGALGIVLFDHPETNLQPLIHKFANLQRDLDDARRELQDALAVQGQRCVGLHAAMVAAARAAAIHGIPGPQPGCPGRLRAPRRRAAAPPAPAAALARACKDGAAPAPTR